MKKLVQETLEQFQKKSRGRGPSQNLVADTYLTRVGGHPCLVDELRFKLIEVPQIAFDRETGVFRPNFMERVKR